MAVNAYLVIDGINGPSTSMTNAIDIMSFSFGASYHSTGGVKSSGAELSSGRASISDISVMKVSDSTTPVLFLDCCLGTKLTSVQVIYTKMVGNAVEPYYKVEMDTVIITSVQDSGSSEHPMESVSFAGATVKVSYNPEKDGALQGWVTKGFNTETLAAV